MFLTICISIIVVVVAFWLLPPVPLLILIAALLGYDKFRNDKRNNQ